jgi:cation transport ATPase
LQHYLSGDSESEVRHLADQVRITEIDAQKVMAATVGMAIGQNSDVTAEAAGVVVMESFLKRVNEFMHFSRRMRTIALQSPVGGVALSIAGCFSQLWAIGVQ